MTKQIWINLPVKDPNKSKEFFTKLGFSFNSQYSSGDDSVSFFIGEKDVVLMLFAESTFKNFSDINITDTKQSSEVLFSIDAESKEEVDEIAFYYEKLVSGLGKKFYKEFKEISLSLEISPF